MAFESQQSIATYMISFDRDLNLHEKRKELTELLISGTPPPPHPNVC